jgi:hypothetical protein
MSHRQARKGKARHAAASRRSLPDATAGRRLAATAAALTAGAVPLALAGPAHAAAGPRAQQPSVKLPLGVQNSLDLLSAAVPLAVGDSRTPETAGALTRPTGDITQPRDASLLTQPNAQPQALVHAAARTVPRLLHEGALGTLSARFSPQADALTDHLVARAAPLTAQLHQRGVPSVGDLTAKLSGTRLPALGSLGALTQTLPVTTALGDDSPVTTALKNLSAL